MGRLAMHSRRCMHVLAVLEAGDGVHLLSDGDEGLQQRALHALEDPAVMEESTLGQRVARGDLSGKEKKILLKAHGEDMAATAQAAVALRGEANKQVADAHTIQLREKADQVRLRKLVSYDNDQIRGEEAELSVQKDELRHAEKVAPHLDTEILLQKEGTFIANAKAQYRKNAADADAAKRKARKLRRESAALAKQAMVPAKRSSKEADPALVAHSERVNAEHAKAMKDLKASVARYVTAIASSRQVRNNAEDSIYHLVPGLVEEARKGWMTHRSIPMMSIIGTTRENRMLSVSRRILTSPTQKLNIERTPLMPTKPKGRPGSFAEKAPPSPKQLWCLPSDHLKRQILLSLHIPRE